MSMQEHTITGILIDPKNRRVATVKVPVDAEGLVYKRAQEALGCDVVDIVQLSDHNDLWVDDEGLLKQPNPYGYFRLNGRVFAGRGLILGYNEEGETGSTNLTPAQLKVAFVDASEAPEPNFKVYTL